MEQRPKTRTELQEFRKQQLKKVGTEFMENHIKTHPRVIEIVKPVYTQASIFPSHYVEHPKAKTKAELDLFRKTQGVFENERTVSFCNKTLSERVEEREKLRILNQPSSSDRYRVGGGGSSKEDDLKQYQEKFTKRPTGIHGEELPKFSDHLQDYWKMKQGYVENPPPINSNPPASRPISVFTRLRAKNNSIDSEITKKPGEINPFPNFTPSEIEGFAQRPSSRTHFMEDHLFSSRPSSRVSAIPVLKKARPLTAVPKQENKPRPFTAGSAVSAKLSDKSVVRSSGFL